MRRALAFVSVLLFSALAGSMFEGFANPIYSSPPWIGLIDGCQPVYWLRSPQNITYNVDQVSLIIVDKQGDLFRSLTYFYILDGKGDLRVDDARVDIHPVKITPELVIPDDRPDDDPYYLYTLEFNVTLPSLTNGSHSLIIGVIGRNPSNWDNPYISELTPNVYFSVEKSAPKVSILSPEDKNYDTATVPLVFKLSEDFIWVGYSLDDKGNVTVTEDSLEGHFFNGNLLFLYGNLTLSGLSAGVHSLSVYAEDSGRRVGVDSCVFTVGQEVLKPESSSTTFPIAMIAVAIAIIASVAVISFGLVAYFVRRNRRRSK